MVEKRPVVSKRRYVYAFLIGTVIFLFGFGLTYSLAFVEYQRVTGLQDPLSYKIFQDKLQYTLFDGDLCSEEGYVGVSEALAFQGRLIGDLESKLGKDNEEVLFRKKFYSLVLLEHFELVKAQNVECGRDVNTILFFYSNEKEDLETSEYLGDLLGIIYERNREDVVIYSFDTNLDSQIIRSLKQKYAVNSPFKVIVNEEYVFNNINNIDDVESVLR